MVGAPGDQVSPPLMGGLVCGYQLLNQGASRIHMESLTVLSIEEGIRRKKDKAGPPLALTPRQLGQFQLAVGIWSESIRIVLNRLSRYFCHRHRVAGGRRCGRSRLVRCNDPRMP